MKSFFYDFTIWKVICDLNHKIMNGKVKKKIGSLENVVRYW